MALFPVNTDYTSKDFDSLLLRLQALARSAFPEWTDFNVANFGNLLLELFAFSTEILTFYQDSQAAESRIVTATQRKNVIALAKLIGFRLAGASAATADVRFTLAAIPTGDVTIPAGTVVRTQEVTDPIRFQLLAPVTIGAGANPPEATGTVENSQTRIETFPSTELANQEFVL
ncbi:MAG: t4-like baseplate wedge, partial [Proteobacteria bacterium]|nr:t4-like baseplate wedge [Pseudomonadota bacterium]